MNHLQMQEQRPHKLFIRRLLKQDFNINYWHVGNLWLLIPENKWEHKFNHHYRIADMVSKYLKKDAKKQKLKAKTQIQIVIENFQMFKEHEAAYLKKVFTNLEKQYDGCCFTLISYPARKPKLPTYNLV